MPIQTGIGAIIKRPPNNKTDPRAMPRIEHHRRSLKKTIPQLVASTVCRRHGVGGSGVHPHIRDAKVGHHSGQCEPLAIHSYRPAGQEQEAPPQRLPKIFTNWPTPIAEMLLSIRVRRSISCPQEQAEK